MLKSRLYKNEIRLIEKAIQSLNENREKAYKYYTIEYRGEYPVQEHFGKEKLKYIKSKYSLNNEEHIFEKFDTYTFGNVAIREEEFEIISGKHINHCNFNNCDFENIVFDHCSFNGTVFDSCKFNRIIFKSCIFSFPVIEHKTLEKNEYYSPTIFKKCWIWGRMEDCDVTYSLFDQVRFSLSEFSNCKLDETVMNQCAFGDVKIKDCNLSNLKVKGSDIFDISFNDSTRIIMNENTFIDHSISFGAKETGKDLVSDSEVKVSDSKKEYYLKSKSLKAVSRVFEINDFSKNSGEYYYKSKLLERESLSGIDRLKSDISLLLCGYGERPLFTFISIVTIILVFALIYMFTGIEVNGESLDYTFSADGIPVSIFRFLIDYGKCVFFSITTFSTVGYGNYLPFGLWSTIFSAIQMITGVGLCALWTGCVLRKLLR